jgi:hypothetical protein
MAAAAPEEEGGSEQQEQTQKYPGLNEHPSGSGYVDEVSSGEFPLKDKTSDKVRDMMKEKHDSGIHLR